MTDEERIKIERKKEMRTKGISKMISEGGLGADNYYNIIKKSSTKEKENSEETNEKDDE